MNKATQKLVLDIAKSIRKKAEKYQEKMGGEEDLTGACLISSYNLWVALKSKDVSAAIAFYDNLVCGHCFLVIENEVLDITATQFDLPRIHIAARESQWFYEENFVFYEVDFRFVEYIKNNWSEKDLTLW